MSKKSDIIIVASVVLLIGVMLFYKQIEISGQASKSFTSTRELGENEQSMYVGEERIIEGKKVTLLSIKDSNEVIVDVSGIQKSINEYGGRIINGFQIENLGVGNVYANLRIVNLGANKEFCQDTDDGDIYSNGKCTDRFYPDGVVDSCDFDELREYTCGYDKQVDEIHCLKHVVDCVDGCRDGACVVK